MYNVFTYRDIAYHPSAEHRIRTALSCCIDRLSHGVFEVISQCGVPGHRPFGYFVDDPEGLRPRGSAVGTPRSSDPRWRRYLRQRHLGWVLAHESLCQDDAVSHRSAALLLGIPYIGPEPTRIELVNPRRSRSARSIHRRQRIVDAAHTMSIIEVLAHRSPVLDDQTAAEAPALPAPPVPAPDNPGTTGTPAPDRSTVRVVATGSAAAIHGPGPATAAIRSTGASIRSLSPQAPTTESGSAATAGADRMITTRARTVVDLARDSGIQTGVVALDAFLDRGERVGAADRRRGEFPPEPEAIAARRETLAEIIESTGHGPGRRRLLTAFEWATGLAESPAESLATVGFHHLGVEGVQQQVWIEDRHGFRVAQVDFLLQSRRLVIEVDGLGKYASAADPNLMRRDVLLDEKEREQRIRECGYTVARLTWADVIDVHRFRRALMRMGLL
ncbi:hypothetical protein ACUXNS_001587 [Brevibacterium pityocampae]